MKVITSESPYELTFDTPPSSDFRNKFSEHVRETLKPEEYSGISTSKPPDKLNRAVMLCRFDLRDSGRTGPKIHCCMCNRKDKFLFGALYWFPQDKRVRLIGNCCAKVHDAQNFEDANNALTQRERFECECDFLDKNLHHTPLLLGEVSKLAPLCKKIMVDRNRFKTMRGFLSEMNKAIKIGGKLNIDVPIHEGEISEFLKSEGAMDKSDYKIQTVHILEGVEYIDTSFNVSKNCEDIRLFFDGVVPPKSGSYDAMLLDLVDDEKAVVKLAGEYRRAVGDLRSLYEFLQKAVKFLSDNNLAGLKRFGADRNTHFPFGLKFDDKAARFEMRSTRTGHVFDRGSVAVVPTITIPNTM